MDLPDDQDGSRTQLLLQAIGKRVDQLSKIKKASNDCFAVQRLGVPSKDEYAACEGIDEPDQCDVRYIHIPRHSVVDFRQFARDAKAEACRDLATNNPYAKALSSHREQLQAALESAPVNSTLEQRLGTYRDSLSELSPVKQAWMAMERKQPELPLSADDRDIPGSSVASHLMAVHLEKCCEAPLDVPQVELIDHFACEEGRSPANLLIMLAARVAARAQNSRETEVLTARGGLLPSETAGHMSMPNL